MRKWIRNTTMAALIMSTFLFSVAAIQAEDLPPSISQEEQLQTTVRGWMDELAKQPDFNDWDKAEFIVQPLGPGTHSWIAIVKSKEKSLGYLVIQAKKDGGFALGEYGTGDYLFDQNKLQQSLLQLELISSLSEANEALYIHPLFAVWHIKGAPEDTYLECASGEWLPLQQATWNKTANAEEELAAKYALDDEKGNSIGRAVRSRSFDPYSRMPWLTEKPLVASADNTSIVLKALSSKEPLRYVAERYNKEMLYVWSVTGYHSWDDNGTVYAALETDELGISKRYIPLKLLAELGSFYH